jgi:hypothetical protein
MRRSGNIVLRSSIGIEKDVAVLQILGFGAVLQMLLKGVAALDWRDGRFINSARLLVFVGHLEFYDDLQCGRSL